MDTDDARLAALGLPPNEAMQEGKPLTDEEEAYLRDAIAPKLKDAAATFGALDETSRVRIFHGMITNNKGTPEERLAEAVEAYERCASFHASTSDILSKPASPGPEKEAVLGGAMNSRVGGLDLYGHQVWAEQLGDIGAVCDHPVTPEEAKQIRCKVMEAVRALQTRAAERRGPRRYKQVYVLDLAEISISSLLTRSAVREMTKAIVGGANDYFPETLWKLFIVNAPFIFRSAYAIVSPIIHPVTKEKIKVLGGKSAYLKEMEKNGIPAEAVPAFLGGTCPDQALADVIPGLAADGFPRAARAAAGDSSPAC